MFWRNEDTHFDRFFKCNKECDKIPLDCGTKLTTLLKENFSQELESEQNRCRVSTALHYLLGTYTKYHCNNCKESDVFGNSISEVINEIKRYGKTIKKADKIYENLKKSPTFQINEGNLNFSRPTIYEFDDYCYDHILRETCDGSNLITFDPSKKVMRDTARKEVLFILMMIYQFLTKEIPVIKARNVQCDLWSDNKLNNFITSALEILRIKKPHIKTAKKYFKTDYLGNGTKPVSEIFVTKNLIPKDINAESLSDGLYFVSPENATKYYEKNLSMINSPLVFYKLFVKKEFGKKDYFDPEHIKKYGY